MIAPLPRRRWFRFGLRTLLVFTLLVGLLMGWVAKERMQSAREKSLWVRHIAFGRALDDYRYYDAYPFMTPAFRRKYSADEFYDQFWTEGRIYPFGSDVEISANPISAFGYAGFHWSTLGSYAQYKWELIDGEWYYTGD